MNLSPQTWRSVAAGMVLVLTSLLALAGCGGGDGAPSEPPPAPAWVAISYTGNGTSTAVLAGTAWVNDAYSASHCVGLGCLLDTTRSDDFPGVTVTWDNLTTGASGPALSYYGPGTNWVHQWTADIPLTGGVNALRIAAVDPGGTGSETTTQVTALPPLNVVATTPLDGESDLPPTTTVSATFSEAIDPAHAVFTVAGPAGPITGTRTVSDASVTFTPGSNLDYGTTYTVTLPTTLRGQSGASLLSDYSWSFTTMAPPTLSVVSTSPANHATGVTPNLFYVSATFNHNLNVNTVSNKLTLSRPGGSVTGTLQVYQATLSFTIAAPLAAGTTYTATLKAGIRDTAGNTLPFDYSWSFTTAN